MSTQIGILKGDNIVFQTENGDYLGGEVISVDEVKAEVLTPHGKFSMAVCDVLLLTTPAEQARQLELTESLEEELRQTKVKLSEQERLVKSVKKAHSETANANRGLQKANDRYCHRELDLKTEIAELKSLLRKGRQT